MIAKNIVRAMEGGDGDGKKGDSGDGQTEENEEKEELSNLERLITSAKAFGMLSTVKEAEEKKEAILKKKKEREPTTAAMSTTKTAKDVLAEKMRLLKQFEDRTNKLETKAQEAVAARIKQAEEKEKAKEREKARHEAAMAALDEEYAMAEKYQTRKLEAAKEDIKKVKEQYQKDLQKIDTFLSSHPGLVEAPPPEIKKEKPPITLETITQHLQTDTTLTGQTTHTRAHCKQFDGSGEKLNQETPAADETWNRKRRSRSHEEASLTNGRRQTTEGAEAAEDGDDDEF